jgi:hypothetical protein
MADYDHHAHMGAYLATHPLSTRYLNSYGNSAAIGREHLLDAHSTLQVMEALPGFFPSLQNRAEVQSLDIGAGEAYKSELIANDLAIKFRPNKFVQHICEPDERQLDACRLRVANQPIPSMEYRFYPMGIEFLIGLWPELGLLPDYVTLFHMLYYLPQQKDRAQPLYGTIPLLARVVSMYDTAPFFIINEGPGQLQNLKWYMRLNYGYGNPVGEHTIIKTLVDSRIPFSVPVHIPNKWRVDMNEIPGAMFERDFEFLLDGNWDCPPITDEHRQAAGVWIQRNALMDSEGAYLDGPDTLIVAGAYLNAL